MTDRDSPFKVLEKVRDNAYKSKLLAEMNMSITFNVDNVAPCTEDDLEDLRTIFSQQREIDAYQTLSQLLVPPHQASYNKIVIIQH